MSVSAVGAGNSAWPIQAQSQPAQPEINDTTEPFGLSTSQLQQPSSGTAPAAGHHGGHHHHRVEMTDTAQLLGLTSSSDSDSDTSTSQDGLSQLSTGQSLASVLAADAYANSATELASSTGASGQISQYS